MSVTTKREVDQMGKETIHLKDRGQVTIPKSIVEELGLSKGDLLEAVIEDGRIVLVPAVAIPKDQLWFWTDEWQAGEREADEDIRAGRTTGPLDIGDALHFLHGLTGGNE